MSNNMTLSEAYDNVYDVVCKLHKVCKLQRRELSHDDLISNLEDGLETYLDKASDDIIASWRDGFQRGGTIYNTFTRKVLAEPERVINGFGEEVLMTKTHYMCELFRIPMIAPCTLINVLKLACYNALLNCAGVRKDDFPEGILGTFKTLEMHKLSAYLNANEATVDNQIVAAVGEMLSGATA